MINTVPCQPSTVDTAAAGMTIILTSILFFLSTRAIAVAEKGFSLFLGLLSLLLFCAMLCSDITACIPI